MVQTKTEHQAEQSSQTEPEAENDKLTPTQANDFGQQFNPDILKQSAYSPSTGESKIWSTRCYVDKSVQTDDESIQVATNDEVSIDYRQRALELVNKTISRAVATVEANNERKKPNRRGLNLDLAKIDELDESSITSKPMAKQEFVIVDWKDYETVMVEKHKYKSYVFKKNIKL